VNQRIESVSRFLAAYRKLLKNMVGTTGFEPATSSVSRKRSNQLSYAPASKWLGSDWFQGKVGVTLLF
jgi:hypothetical protein